MSRYSVVYNSWSLNFSHLHQGSVQSGSWSSWLRDRGPLWVSGRRLTSTHICLLVGGAHALPLFIPFLQSAGFSHAPVRSVISRHGDLYALALYVLALWLPIVTRCLRVRVLWSSIVIIGETVSDRLPYHSQHWLQTETHSQSLCESYYPGYLGLSVCLAQHTPAKSTGSETEVGARFLHSFFFLNTVSSLSRNQPSSLALQLLNRWCHQISGHIYSPEDCMKLLPKSSASRLELIEILWCLTSSICQKLAKNKLGCLKQFEESHSIRAELSTSSSSSHKGPTLQD